MEKSVNEKLADWIKEKAEKEYAGDISVVVLYGSYINKTANAKSDLDCYFIPKTERAYQFAKDFIIKGIGYDIFPITWERAEDIADLKEVLLPLIGDAKVIYYHSEDDLCRFGKLQDKLRNNLEDGRISYAAAAEKVNNAYESYQRALCGGTLAQIRKNAGYSIMSLADAVAFYHHTYYHFGLKRQFSDLRNIPGVPEQICEEYLRVIQAESKEDILMHCSELLRMVCQHMDMKVPDGKTEEEERHEAPLQADFAALSGLYEEISSTFNKIDVCCENGDYILAYLSSVCLQNDLDYAHEGLGAGRYDLFGAFDYRDLKRLQKDVKAVEDDFVNFITHGGGIIKRYDSFEEFAEIIDR